MPEGYGGLFNRHGSMTSGGFPVYVNNEGNFLYFVSEFISWYFGEDIITSNALFATSNTNREFGCPNTHSTVNNRHSSERVDGVTIECEMSGDPLTPFHF